MGLAAKFAENSQAGSVCETELAQIDYDLSIREGVMQRRAGALEFIGDSPHKPSFQPKDHGVAFLADGDLCLVVSRVHMVFLGMRGAKVRPQRDCVNKIDYNDLQEELNAQKYWLTKTGDEMSPL